MRRLFAATMLLLALLSAGCEMSVNMTTTVLPTVEIDQEMVMKIEGLEGDAPQDLLESIDPSELADGWAQEVKTEGDTLTMRVHKRLKIGDSLLPPDEGDYASAEASYDLQVIDMPREREYRLAIHVPARQSPAQQPATLDPGQDPTLAVSGEELGKVIAEMFQVSWTVNMPGEVVDTNADARTKTGGIWEFPLDQTHERDLRIVSREPKS